MAKARRKHAAPKRKATRARHHGKVGRPKGYKCSAATRAKMSKARKAWWKSHKGGRRKAVATRRHGKRRGRR